MSWFTRTKSIRGVPAAGVILLLCTYLAGCSSGLFPIQSLRSTATATQAPIVQPSTSVTEQTPVQEETPGLPDELVIWLPPQFDPAAGNPAARLLRERLQAFSQAHNNITVVVRIKAESGSGGMLDALSTANSAAPLALPDLVALPRSDLEVAALKGLLVPFDGLTTVQDDADWYACFRQLALLQGSTLGLPFAGDALVLVYRPVRAESIPTSWDALISQGGLLAFPAADPQALFTLSLYLSAGGSVEDQQHRPTLEPDILAAVLGLVEKGVAAQVISPNLAQYQTDSQVWQAFKEQRADWVVTWVSNYLAELPADASMLPLLPAGDHSSTIATGYVWALANPPPGSQTLAVELAEWLVQGDFLAQWTAAAGLLPPRPTALASWPNQNLQSLISQVVLSAQLRPGSDLMPSLGTALSDAILSVLSGKSDAFTAAQSAVDHLTGP
jgi:multiple sugar transport system substrate-binding protein